MLSSHQFDFVISNPPYQDSSNSAIFHEIQNFADKVGAKTAFIYPADKWMTKNGRGEKFDEFCNHQLHDITIRKVVIYENTKHVFPTIELHGGISIVIKDKSILSNDFVLESYESDGFHSLLKINQNLINSLSTSNRMNKIVEKVRNMHDGEYLSSVVQPSAFYNIPSNFIEKSHDYINDSDFINDSGYGDSEFDGQSYVRILTNSKTGKGGRVGWFWIPRNNVVKNIDTIDKFKVAISPRNAAGYGGRSQNAYVYAPGEIFGDCRFCIGVFDEQATAENFAEYLSNSIIRALILSSSRRVKNFGVNVPLLNDYANIPELTNYLKDLYSLDDDDMGFVESVNDSLGNFFMNEKC